MKRLIARFIDDDEGQDLIEYALLAGFISLVAIIAITLLGTGINEVFQGLADTVAGIGG
jgi:pilus assembly protein Flp/PilA